MKSAVKEIRPSIHRLKIFGRVYEREQVVTAAVLMAPVLAAVFMLFILPVVQVVYYSFTNMTTSKRGTFVGLENFKYLIGDSKFFKSIGNTVLFADVFHEKGILIGFASADHMVNVNDTDVRFVEAFQQQK